VNEFETPGSAGSTSCCPSLLRVLEIVRADLDSPDAETPDGVLDWHPADVPAFLRRAAYDEPKAKKKPKFR
jgi:hypothetical protein